ncbi:MAG: alkaline phosphatase D family protein [Parvibaculum sp.]
MAELNRRDFLKSFTAVAGCFAFSASLPFTPAYAEGISVNPARFPQGLASGDPQSDAIMLWTRATPNMPAGDIAVTAQVALDEEFTSLIVERALTLDATSDFTARVFVEGLAPDTRYFYRFIANGEVSRHTGRTRTAPAPDSERTIRYAFTSCQNFERGFYGAWSRLVADDMAATEDDQLDFVLHLGDFIYEVIGDVPAGVDASRKIPPFPDGSEPWVPDGTKPYWTPGATWAVTLDDYRHLYKTYLSDPDLQAARARFPFICTWDDHEFTNDCWQAHDTYFDDGKPAQTRKLAANQAWFEFIPAILSDAQSIGDVANQASDFKRASVSNSAYGAYDDALLNTNRDNLSALASMTIYRALSFGKMLDMVVTDLRSYRSPPVVNEPVKELLGGSSRINVIRIIKELDAGRTANNGEPNKTLTFQDRTIDNPRLTSPMGTCMGAAQKQWFKNTLKASNAKWRVWANSIPAVAMRLNLSQVPSVDLEDSYLGIDAWQGFPGELAELMGFVKQESITNLVSCSGDYHTHAAGRLAVDLDADEPEFVAVDFATTSISSGNLFMGAESALKEGDAFRPFVTYQSGDKLIENFNNTVVNGVRSGLVANYTGSAWLAGLFATASASPGLEYLDSNAHGYGLATLSAEGATMTLVNVGSIAGKAGPEGQSVLRRTTFQVASWADGSTPSLGTPIFEGTPPFPFA